MSQADVLLDAFKEGKEKLGKMGLGDNYQEGAYDHPLGRGNPIQTIGEYDPTNSPYLDQAFSSLNVDRHGLKPGQKLGAHGTTVYNPLRSSKEVEAVLGEKKYDPAIEPKSPEQMRVKQVELENQVDTLQKQMAILVAAIQTQAQSAVDGGNVAPIPMIPAETPLEARTVSDLRNEAKERSLPYVGKNKKTLIEILKNAPAIT